jgi:cytochrome c-type biogenesis protein CcmH
MFFATASLAIDVAEPLDDPELQARYEKIIDEVRCLKCQNNTIKDSSAFLAADLRREIRRMLEEGMTDAEIFNFLVDRYGECTSGKTLILWIAPAIFLFGGALMLWRIVRRRMAMPIDDDPVEEA